MLSLCKRLLKEERGAVIVIIALAFTALLGFAALVVDIGKVALEQNRLVRAADAAALAGAQELPDTARAQAVAQQYAQLNGVTINPSDIVISPDSRQINVTVSKTFDLFFGKALGFNSKTKTASAMARISPLKSINGEAVPFSVQKQTFNYGQEYILKEGAGGVGQDGDRWCAWFGALDLTGGGGGANEYRDTVKTGYSGTIQIGDVIDIETGNMAGPTCDGVEWRVAQCTHTPPCTWDNFNPECKRLIYVPVVETYAESGGRRSVKVVGFAAFFLKGVEGQQGSNGNVIGYFVRETISGETDDSAADYGLDSVKLTQ